MLGETHSLSQPNATFGSSIADRFKTKDFVLNFWILQAINGISYGMLLFLLAAGLSLVFGLMNIVNLAHGSYYLIGVYIGLTVNQITKNFVLAVVAASLAVAVLGMLMQRLVLRHLYEKPMAQALLTIGFLFLFADISLVAWGGNPQNIPPPAPFQGAMTIGGITFPSYRLVVIGVGLAVALFLWWFQEGTRVGAVIRAAVDDEEMAQGVGINVPRASMLVFGLGAGLAALGGVMGGPFIGGYPGVDLEVLLLALVVVIVGGIGSLRGAFVGAIAIGLLDNFGKALFPELSLFTLFAPMALILVFKPNGLFGRA